MTAISVDHLRKRFGSFVAVDDLSFTVPEKHVVGFLGPNGAGKTTTLRMLVGLSRPTSGAITMSNTPVVFGQTTRQKTVGYLPEQPAFYNWLTGREYLTLLAELAGVPQRRVASEVDRLLALVALTAAQRKRVGGYSGGMRQRLGIAQALLGEPAVLILDEPVSALDPLGRKEVLAVIEQLRDTCTVFFSTHILADVDRICSDVVLIHQGRLVVAQPLAELKATYAAPILRVECLHDPAPLLPALRQESWVQRCEQDGRLLKVWLTDEAVLQDDQPLRFFAAHSLGVLQYGLTLPDAEDLFVALVEGQHG